MQTVVRTGRARSPLADHWATAHHDTHTHRSHCCSVLRTFPMRFCRSAARHGTHTLLALIGSTSWHTHTARTAPAFALCIPDATVIMMSRCDATVGGDVIIWRGRSAATGLQLLPAVLVRRGRGRRPDRDHERRGGASQWPELCHSAAPPSHFSRCFNTVVVMKRRCQHTDSRVNGQAAHPEIVARLAAVLASYQPYVTGHLPRATLDANYTAINTSHWGNFEGECRHGTHAAPWSFLLHFGLSCCTGLSARAPLPTHQGAAPCCS